MVETGRLSIISLLAEKSKMLKKNNSKDQRRYCFFVRGTDSPALYTLINLMVSSSRKHTNSATRTPRVCLRVLSINIDALGLSCWKKVANSMGQTFVAAKKSHTSTGTHYICNSSRLVLIIPNMRIYHGDMF